MYVLLDEFGPIMSVAIFSGFLVSIVAYISAFFRGAQHRMTGYHVYDFFMGAELNPRMFGWLDFKMFFEVRLPWFILFLISLSAAARQYELYGYVSAEVCFLLMAHYLYANACSKGEEMIVTTWDMYYEKWGFMLIFWNLAGVPLSYCHCTIYLANHDPATYAWSRPAIFLFFTTYLFMYWIWDSSQSQKNMYRLEQRGHYQDRWVFPRLPWRHIKNPEVIESPAGTIMVDGWYKYARKIHYTCDLYFAISWGLITGFDSPFPWFYSVFFAIMIVHRAYRDIQRCREKYGDAWKEYERRTPYLFIPVSGIDHTRKSLKMVLTLYLVRGIECADHESGMGRLRWRVRVPRCNCVQTLGGVIPKIPTTTYVCTKVCCNICFARCRIVLALLYPRTFPRSRDQRSMDRRSAPHAKPPTSCELHDASASPSSSWPLTKQRETR